MLFYNFQTLAALFSSNHIWSNTFLHYNILFFFFLSFSQSTNVCTLVRFKCLHIACISLRAEGETLDFKFFIFFLTVETLLVANTHT